MNETIMRENNLPLISLIIPIYNTENYLDLCLSSLEKQTYRNLEIILINNGSTDISQAIIDKYTERDKRFKVYNIEKNEGIIPAYNLGLQQVRGEFLTFPCSDDFFHPQYIETLYEGIEENNADISICNYYKKQSSEEQTYIELFQQSLNPNEITFEVLKDYERWHYFFASGCFWFLWNKLFKRTLYKDFTYPSHHPILDVLVDDFYPTYQCFNKAEKIVLTDIPLIFFRQHQKQTTQTEQSTFEYRKERIQFLLPYFLKLHIQYPDNILITDQFRREWQRLKQQIQTEEQQNYYLQLKQNKEVQSLFMPDLILEY